MMQSNRSAPFIALLASAMVLWIPPRASSQALAMEIHSLKPSYLVAEPVLIDISVKNVGDRTVTVSPELTVESENVSLFIARGSEPFQEYKPGFVQEPSQMPVALASSEALTHRQLVLFNGLTREFAFPSAGVYRIRALLHGFNLRKDVKSNNIEIRVDAPSGRDAEAMQLFKTPDVAHLVIGIDESADGVTNLERLITDYPATIYGKYAQFYLARRQTHEFFQRNPSFEHAATLYRSLIERDPSFPLATEARYELGQALLRIGRYADARNNFEIVLRETQITRLAEGARRSLASIQQRQQYEPKK